jgi:hypothetical protein
MEIMALRNAGKKQDPFAKEPNPNSYILFYTTTRLIGIIKSWKQVYEILVQENSLYSDDSSGG